MADDDVADDAHAALMTDWATHVYLSEVIAQGRAAQLAFADLHRAVAATPMKSERAYAAALSLLAAAAMLGKFFWPPPPRKKDPVALRRAKVRATHLRGVLDVTDASILNNRDVRNSFEHFDGHLDEVLSTGRPIADRNIGARAAYDGAIMLRHIDPHTVTISALDDSVDVIALMEEISLIGAAAERWNSAYFDWSSTQG